MNPKEPNLALLNVPIVEIPAHQIWHRVQLKTARRNSIRFKGYVLAPPSELASGFANRFDLADEPVTYLADSPETALYEALFRRNVTICHWERIEQRVLAAFETQKPIRLAYLRGQEEQYPVLQSMRYESSQKLAKDYREKGLDGVLYASAQHPHHGCICLFKSGMEHTKKLEAIPLVQPTTKLFHKAVITAQRGSQVPILLKEEQ